MISPDKLRDEGLLEEDEAPPALERWILSRLANQNSLLESLREL